MQRFVGREVVLHEDRRLVDVGGERAGFDKRDLDADRRNLLG
jgi:hypothetical protein